MKKITEVKQIKVKEIVRSGLNPRQIVRPQLKESELYRSIKQNGVQHPIEVREISKGGQVHYELLSGERRLSASEELKLTTIPAIVYTDMTAAEAYEKTHFENRGREDLTPIEMAADAQNLMAVYQGDLKAVASTLGIAPKAVKLRLQLQNLSPAWVKVLRAPNTKPSNYSVHNLSIAHLELIARMDHAIQDELLDGEDGLAPDLCHFGGVITVGNLRSLIASRYTMSLTGAPWDLGETLITDAVACVKCTKRSDSEIQRELWGDEEKEDKKPKDIVRCLDGACFNRKFAAWRDKTVAEAQEQHEGLRVVGNQATKEKYGQLAVTSAEIVPAKKGEKGAFPVLVLDNAKKRIAYAKPAEPDPATVAKSIAKPKTLAERREQLRGQRLVIVLAKLKAEIQKGAWPLEKVWTLELMASMVAVFGVTGNVRVSEQNPAIIDLLQHNGKVMARKNWAEKDMPADLTMILWWKLVPDLLRLLHTQNGADGLSKEADGRWLASLIGFDWDKAFEQACEEKKEPKAWALLPPDPIPKITDSKGQKAKGQKAA
jgi:ParB/RepB/Spo0J family partition protein